MQPSVRGWTSAETGMRETGQVLSAPQGDWVHIAVQAAVVSGEELRAPAGLVAGGSAVGQVIETGDDATHLLGKRVALGPLIPCGECDVCRRGAVAVCPDLEVLGRTINGALADRVAARARWLCVLEDELELEPPSAALVGRELADAYTMYARSSVSPGEPVVILGDGVRGRLLVQIAVAGGSTPMALTFADGPYRDWLESAGAVPISVAKPGPEAARDALVLASGASGHGSRPWRIFESSGTRELRALALAVAGPGASLTFAPPIDHDGAELDGARIAALDARVIGVAGAHPDLTPEAAALVVRGDVDLEAASCLIESDELDRAAELASAEPHRALIVLLS